MPTLTWSNGYIRNDTGAVGSDPKGLVSNTFAGDGRTWHVSVATGFKIIKAARYGGSSRGTFEAIVMPLGEYTDFDITFENGKYYSFALTNANTSNISPSDVSNDTVEMTAYGVTISYQNSTIATMDTTGVKTLLTGATFCEDDIVVSYTAPSLPSGRTTVTDNGTYDISQYASVMVAVPSASGVSF